jgi:hypothetical protein
MNCPIRNWTIDNRQRISVVLFWAAGYFVYAYWQKIKNLPMCFDGHLIERYTDNGKNTLNLPICVTDAREMASCTGMKTCLIA